MIKLLPDDVWSKIAAGEVVERPSSVVKELVENSIDVGAKRIRVSLWDGGKSRIIVEDDGGGISFQDLPLAVAQHATSKLSTTEDLNSIITLGYRGEAIASIASVSKLEIRSCSENETGGMIRVNEGRIIEHIRIACPKGTRVQVSDLFYTIPARKKFLKASLSELRRCSIVLRDYALAWPGISFGLSHEGKALFTTDGNGNRKRALSQIWGDSPELTMAHVTSGNLSLECWYQAFPLRGRNEISAFLNGRAVNDPIIRAAVSNAGKEFSGNWALFITINPSLIDVNIHPAKAEIRFRYTGEVFDSIKKASIILSGNPSKLVFSSTKNGNDDVNVPGNQPRPGYIHNLSFSGRSQNLFTRTASSFDTELQPNISEPNSKSLSAFADSPFKKGGIQNEVVDGPTFNEGSKINEAYVLNATLSDTENYVAKGDNNKSSNYNDQESDLADLNDSESDVKFISQLSSGYLIFETSSSVIIMDPHAAHERIMYEAIMKKSIDGIMTQMLISPEPLQPTLAIQVQELEKELFSVGFSFKNENGLYLTGIPFNLGNISAPLSILRATLAVWSDNGKVCKLDEQLMARWAEIACKSSVKLSSVIHPSEARDLWKKLHTCKQPYSCPHGRPTILKIENSELSKHFGRSV